MIPIGDDPHEGGPPPLVTVGLILLNAAAFFLELNRPEGAVQAFVQAWGVVPKEYSTGRDLAPLIPLPFWSTLVTSMFLHGGWAHLGGNMLYLWIFGDNIEKRVGHARFLAFYLVCGLAAAAAHIAFNSGSTTPTIGASGAISGVLGGYLLLFPRNRVRVLTGFGVAAVPAATMLILWIVIQFVNGAGQVARTPETGGVAYLAHIGGFAAGLLLVRLIVPRGAPGYRPRDRAPIASR
jgi:membrane associated rhomboid family serine protease